jgi:hypothetical protein
MLKNFIDSHTNLEVFADTIISDDFEMEKNALLKTIVNGISKRIVNAKILNNKLKELKGDKIPYGSQIEEIIANPAKGTPYVMSSSDLLTQTASDIKSVYYKINRQDKYPATISDIQLQRALLNPNGLDELVQMIVGSLYSGDNLDEMAYTKQLISNAVLNNKVMKVIIGDAKAGMTDPAPKMTLEEIIFDTGLTQKDKMKLFVAKVKELTINFTFGNSAYNGYKAVKGAEETDLTTACEISEQVILLRSDIYSKVDVELLATAFNMTKTEFEQKVIPVDEFNGMDVWCLLCDKKWFRINDTYYGLKRFDNGSNLTANYWLHHHSTFGYNLLSNAVAFIDTQDPTLNRGV